MKYNLAINSDQLQIMKGAKYFAAETGLSCHECRHSDI